MSGVIPRTSRWLGRRWLGVLLGLMAFACSSNTSLPWPPPPTAIKTEVLVTSVGIYNVLQVQWTGIWLSAAPDTPTGGAETAGGSLALPPAGQTALISFPEAYVRPGVWNLAILVVGDGTNVLLSTSCEVELLAYKTTAIRFTEGLEHCAASAGGHPTWP